MSPRERLSSKHRRALEVDSGIARDLIEGRGVWTVNRGRDLPDVFSRRQRRRGRGMLFKIHRPNGETAWCYRPDELDPDNPGCKYEQPSKHYGGPGNVLDVHPDNHHLIDDTGVPVIFVEGLKKADSVVTALRAAGEQAVVIAISGVWNWLSAGEPIPDMFDVPVEGRKVTILFDSDLLSNPSVQGAAGGLAEHLIGRGAEVWITYLKDDPDGSKVGADDFFVGGGTLPELRMLTGRYDPADFARVRVSRDKKLRSAVEDLWRRWWDFDWARLVGTGERPNSMRGHTCRDIMKVLIDAVTKHGVVTADGVRAGLARRTLSLRASTSVRTTHKAIRHLEAEGWLRFEPPKSKEKPGSYVLLVDRAILHQVGTEPGPEQEVTQELQRLHGGGEGLRAPRLRWSSPGSKKRRGVVRGTRRVREAPSPQARPVVRRFGKVRGALLDALDAAGGTATLREMAAALHRKRPRDVRRRILPMLEEAGIVAVDGDLVSLADDWLDRLKEAQELGGEVEQDQADRRRYRLQSKAFRERGKARPTPHWTAAGDADGAVEDLEHVGERLSPEDSEVLAAIRAFEGKYGRGSFRWDGASCKRMFYTGPIRGHWPEADQLRRIRDHLEAFGDEGVAA